MTHHYITFPKINPFNLPELHALRAFNDIINILIIPFKVDEVHLAKLADLATSDSLDSCLEDEKFVTKVQQQISKIESEYLFNILLGKHVDTTLRTCTLQHLDIFVHSLAGA